MGPLTLVPYATNQQKIRLTIMIEMIHKHINMEALKKPIQMPEIELEMSMRRSRK